MSKHIHIELRDRDGERDANRPHLELWVGAEDNFQEPNIVLSIGPLMGEQQRYIDLSSEQARQLARVLKQLAQDVDVFETETEDA